MDMDILNNVYINYYNVKKDLNRILTDNLVTTPKNFTAWLIKAITLIDLTTLAGDDTRSNVRSLCVKAVNPVSPVVCRNLGFTIENDVSPIHTAAVCVYPNRVRDVAEFFEQINLTDQLQIASVATGFPTGLYPLKTKLEEIKFAVNQGATEIDVVIDRSLVLTGQWDNLYQEISEMHEACGEAHLKVILGVGELGTLINIYKASMVAMMAGAHFIKTSTGKETVNATLPVGLVMCRTIKDYYQHTGRRVGLKPAGGIKTPRDAVSWLVMVKSELGEEWLTPKLFRIGASSLLGSIEKCLQNC